MIDGRLSIDGAYESGKVMLKVRETINACKSQLENNFVVLDGTMREVDELITSAPSTCVGPEWRILRTGLAVLASQGKCLSIAHGEEGNLEAEQIRLAVLFRELQGQIRSASDNFPAPIDGVRRDLCESGECDCNLVAKLLLGHPLPLIYWKAQQHRFLEADTGVPQKKSPPPLVRIIAFLDSVPITTPQLILPGELYSLNFRVKGIGWPVSAESLQLTPLSTCPQEEYSLSRFELSRPTLSSDAEYQDEVPGHIKFISPQSSVFDDIVFRLRGAFKLSDGEFEDVPIIGHDEIRVRVVKPEGHPLMGGNRRLDRHIEELVVKLVKECPSIKSEIGDLVPMLQALNLLLATYAQEAIFKGRNNVLESEFHATVLHDLRIQLGQDVQNHPNQAGGIGDVRFRGLIVELKVERDNGDRQKICRKYAAQPTQYAGVEARQVSILLVLDLTEKVSPPGDIRNDVLLVDVPAHGGRDATKTHPSKAFVFVVNGNVKSPSDYSK